MSANMPETNLTASSTHGVLLCKFVLGGDIVADGNPDGRMPLYNAPVYLVPEAVGPVGDTSSGEIMMPMALRSTTDSEGRLNVRLWATDLGTGTSTGWRWKIIVNPDSAYSRVTIRGIEIKAGTVSQLADIMPTQDSGGEIFYYDQLITKVWDAFSDANEHSLAIVREVGQEAIAKADSAVLTANQAKDLAVSSTAPTADAVNAVLMDAGTSAGATFATKASMDSARMDAVMRSSVTTGVWAVASPTPGALHLSTEISPGHWWGWRLARLWDAPGKYTHTYTGCYSVIGSPLLTARPGYGTFSTGWTASYSLPGSTATAHVDLIGPGPTTVTGKITAGSRDFDVPAGTVDSTFIGSQITIPGALAGGDLVTRITNVVPYLTPEGKQRIALNTSPLPDVSMESATGIITSVLQASPADSTTATVSWTSPDKTTRLGVSTAGAANGGIFRVEVDGKTSLANRARTGQEMLERGDILDTDMVANGGPIDPMGRYIDGYYSRPTPDMPWLVATDLSPGVHTITLTATGVKHIKSVNSRIYISGWGWGTEETTPATAGAKIFAEDWVIPPESAIEYAHQVEVNGGDAEFLGSQHGLEDQQGALTVRVDGAQVAITPQKAGRMGASITVTRRSLLRHPSSTSPIAESTMDWTCSVGQPLVVSHHMMWKQSVNVIAGYPCHTNVDASTMPWAQVIDRSNALAVTAGDNSWVGVGRHAGGVTWGDRSAMMMLVRNPDAATGGWRSLPTILHGIRARREQGCLWAKWYLSRAHTVLPGEVWAADALYAARTLPAGPDGIYPVGG